MIRKLLLTLFVVLLNIPLLFAQEVEMADTMRSNGKIYVVVAVLVTVLTGMLVYIIYLDRKVTGLEKKIKK